MTKHPTKIKTWKSLKNGQHYWHASKVGRIKCDGGEGYVSRASLMRSIRRLINDFKNDNWVVE